LTTPISNVISSVIRFGIQMILVLLFLAYFLMQGVVHPNWLHWLLIPVELIHLGILGMGFGIIISSMTTKYRDLTILVEFGVQAWMYLTPVVYPLSTLAEGWMKNLLMINPVTTSIEMMRYAILGQGTIHMGYYSLSWVMTVLVAVFGIMIFNKVERTFMDTV
jgi:lipopolysaccharide transport system permease protein